MSSTNKLTFFSVPVGLILHISLVKIRQPSLRQKERHRSKRKGKSRAHRRSEHQKLRQNQARSRSRKLWIQKKNIHLLRFTRHRLRMHRQLVVRSPNVVQDLKMGHSRISVSKLGRLCVAVACRWTHLVSSRFPSEFFYSGIDPKYLIVEKIERLGGMVVQHKTLNADSAHRKAIFLSEPGSWRKMSRFHCGELCYSHISTVRFANPFVCCL